MVNWKFYHIFTQSRLIFILWDLSTLRQSSGSNVYKLDLLLMNSLTWLKTMKLIILILIIFSGSVSEAYRLPALTVRLNIEDSLNLVKLFKGFINSIDTNDKSNLKQFLNTTKLTKKESLPRPNPNTFFSLCLLHCQFESY